MGWFLFDRDLRHERAQEKLLFAAEQKMGLHLIKKKALVLHKEISTYWIHIFQKGYFQSNKPKQNYSDSDIIESDQLMILISCYRYKQSSGVVLLKKLFPKMS